MEVQGSSKQLMPKSNDLMASAGTADIGGVANPNSSLRRRNSINMLRRPSLMLTRANSVLKLLKGSRDGRQEEDEQKDDGEEEKWQLHPVQERFSLGNVQRLSKSCLDQVSHVPYGKKKRVSGIRETESTLRRLVGKLETEHQMLSQFQHSEGMSQLLTSLQDTLVLLARNLSKVSKRKYFLDAACSKRMLALHHSLNAAENEVFMSLHRALIASTLGRSFQTNNSAMPVSDKHGQAANETEEEIFDDNAFCEDTQDKSAGYREQLKTEGHNLSLNYMTQVGVESSDSLDDEEYVNENKQQTTRENQPHSEAIDCENESILEELSADEHELEDFDDETEDEKVTRNHKESEVSTKPELGLEEHLNCASSWQDDEQVVVAVTTAAGTAKTLSAPCSPTPQRKQSTTAEFLSRFVRLNNKNCKAMAYADRCPSQNEKREPATCEPASPGRIRGVSSPTNHISPFSSNRDTTDAKALFRMGKACFYSDGLDTDQDNRQAVVYFCRAAEMGYVPAIVSLGRLYETGTGVDVADPLLVRHFYSCAAKMGSAVGMSALAAFNLEHLDELSAKDSGGGEKMVPEARAKLIESSIALLRKAAVLGESYANCLLGELYLSDGKELGIEHDEDKAKALFAVAVQKGHARAQNNLAVLLLRQPETRRQGLELMKVSAAKGCAKAINNLGIYYERMLVDDQEGAALPNLPLALKHYAKAAAHGLPLATHNLAVAFFQQARALHDKESYDQVTYSRLLERANTLFLSAAARDIVDAHHYLGLLQLAASGSSCQSTNPSHVAKVQAAIHHFMQVLQARERLSSKILYRCSALRLGDLYYKRQHYQKAFTLYRVLADQENDPDAINAIGLMHENGKCSAGATPDFVLAAASYSRAHQLGHSDASVNLAVLHLKGCHGVDKNVVRSKELLQFAACMAHSDQCKARAERILKTMETK